LKQPGGKDRQSKPLRFHPGRLAMLRCTPYWALCIMKIRHLETTLYPDPERTLKYTKTLGMISRGTNPIESSSWVPRHNSISRPHLSCHGGCSALVDGIRSIPNRAALSSTSNPYIDTPACAIHPSTCMRSEPVNGGPWTRLISPMDPPVTFGRVENTLEDAGSESGCEREVITAPHQMLGFDARSSSREGPVLSVVLPVLRHSAQYTVPYGTLSRKSITAVIRCLAT
jgi:hypothetical protein